MQSTSHHCGAHSFAVRIWAGYASRMKSRGLFALTLVVAVSGFACGDLQCPNESVAGNFSSADLTGCNLASANIESTNLSNANLAGVDLSSSDIRNSNFSGADLTGANFTSADLANINFSNADLTNAIFSSADLPNANFTGATLTGANFNSADLSNPNCTNAVGGDFSGATVLGGSCN